MDKIMLMRNKLHFSEECFTLRQFDKCGLTGGKNSGDDAAPQGAGDGLQAHRVLRGGT